ncbi:MAG: hypothetical protein WC717_01570 [Candidatus Micrarchaeia archaeon]|jgi:hypothetical protein
MRYAKHRPKGRTTPHSPIAQQWNMKMREREHDRRMREIEDERVRKVSKDKPASDGIIK